MAPHRAARVGAVILPIMDLADAIERANRILDEERIRPTVEYHDPVMDWMLLSQQSTIPNMPKPKAPEQVLELLRQMVGLLFSTKKESVYRTRRTAAPCP